MRVGYCRGRPIVCGWPRLAQGGRWPRQIGWEWERERMRRGKKMREKVSIKNEKFLIHIIFKLHPNPWMCAKCPSKLPHSISTLHLHPLTILTPYLTFTHHHHYSIMVNVENEGERNLFIHIPHEYKYMYKTCIYTHKYTHLFYLSWIIQVDFILVINYSCYIQNPNLFV